MAIANGNNDNTHIQRGDRGGQQRDIPIGAHKIFLSQDEKEKIERLYGEKRNLMMKIQEAWFEYRAVKSKDKELQMEPGFLTRLWPRKADDLSECWRGSNHQVCAKCIRWGHHEAGAWIT